MSNEGSYVEKSEFNRDTNYIEDRITADGRDGAGSPEGGRTSNTV